MARKRRFTTFSLSFLDIMSCGLGAVALIFLIIKHEVDTKVEVENQDLQAEVNLLEEEILDGQEGLVRVRNTISSLDERLVQARGLARRINEDIEAVRSRIKELDPEDEAAIDSLREELRKLETEKEKLEAELEERGNDVRRYIGQGNRQYLTGMKLGGARVLILLDASASMLDDTLVNIIRRRNMSDNVKRSSKKWQRMLATTEWLVAQLPVGGQYQIYTFNTEVKPALKNTRGQWQATEDRDLLDKAIMNLREVIPEGGTSLVNTFQSVAELNDLPDNIFLITDGLPTQGKKRPKGNTISGPDRLRLFNNALKSLPANIPVNIILAPMEGDPMAASAFWKLAQVTRGSFISPSKDWP